MLLQFPDLSSARNTQNSNSRYSHDNVKSSPWIIAPPFLSHFRTPNIMHVITDMIDRAEAIITKPRVACSNLDITEEHIDKDSLARAISKF